MSPLNPLLRPGLPPGDGGGQGPGIDLQVMADLSVNLGRVADEMTRQRQRQERFFRSLHLFTVGCPPITAASQTLSVADLMGPVTGKIWDVRSVNMQGFTAGTVLVYKGQASGWNQRYTFLQAGINYWSSAQLMLTGNDTLVFVSDGSFAGTAAPTIEGIEFDEALLPDYLL